MFTLELFYIYIYVYIFWSRNSGSAFSESLTVQNSKIETVIINMHCSMWNWFYFLNDSVCFISGC